MAKGKRQIAVGKRRLYDEWRFGAAADSFHANSFTRPKERKLKFVGLRISTYLAERMDVFLKAQRGQGGWGTGWTYSAVLRLALMQFLERWETGQDKEAPDA